MVEYCVVIDNSSILATTRVWQMVGAHCQRSVRVYKGVQNVRVYKSVHESVKVYTPMNASVETVYIQVYPNLN